MTKWFGFVSFYPHLFQILNSKILFNSMFWDCNRGFTKGNTTNIALIWTNWNVDTFCKSYHHCFLCLMLYRGIAIFFLACLLIWNVWKWIMKILPWALFENVNIMLSLSFTCDNKWSLFTKFDSNGQLMSRRCHIYWWLCFNCRS